MKRIWMQFCFSLIVLSGAMAAPQPDTLWMDLAGQRLGLLYYCNGTIEQSDSMFTRAVVVVHGSGRNADGYYDRTYVAAQMAGQSQLNTIIVAPYFMIDDDGIIPGILYWDYNNGWKQGDASSSFLPRNRSSFAVMDTIVWRLLQFQPNLRKIVIAGHSAGGQFVNRYAAGNRIQLAVDSVFAVSMSYLVANPSSYVYMNNKRRVNGTMDQFAVPTNSGCQSSYNDYKYGLNDLNSYMWHSTADSIRQWYKQREVYYLLGENDTDPNDSSLDTSCPAELQGAFRLERGLIYYNYLGYYYGQDVYEHHFLATIPNVAHSSTGIFQSTCGRYVLFGRGSCDPLALENEPSYPETISLLEAWPNPFNGAVTFTFTLPHSGRVDLRIYSQNGSQIADLYSEQFFRAGSHKFTWSAENLATGMYFAKFRIDNSSRVVKKLIYLK